MSKDTSFDKPTVVVIDDDKSVCEALRGLFESVGLSAQTYGSVQQFMADDRPTRPGCLVVDIRLPGQSGLELQEMLARTGTPRSVVFISGHVDVPMAVRAMRGGAVDVLTKPVREQDLLEAVHKAIRQDALCLGQTKLRTSLEARYAKLTVREREIMALVVTGMQNSRIATEVRIAEATVKLHRGQVMRKMAADSIAALVRMADLLNDGHAAALDQSSDSTRPMARFRHLSSN
ncbi:response regulator transcription factor [Mesorhizobium sp. WSM4307]|uniref:response regulator transcription factor n=1 Tax=unclassified Mesorhizobium TaxID=325217 RepID=UPI00115D1EC5|nr:MULTISPECIES: response regulator [unclassified Mesorhizobium]TRC75535.1 response regulator transcription factor [Mesorhizobium sp. WSM4315]TRC86456.1 response regulator transcription factor [Mesorhizobium sp. WSM4307]